MKHSILARIVAPLLITTALTACASAPPGSRDEMSQNDPLEGLNRVIFNINTVLDQLILRPIASIYRGIMPSFVRNGVSNALTNAWAPVTFFNSLLQGDMTNATNVFGRFVVNTTAGIGGIFDVAAEAGMKSHSEDFGQTLGAYGAGPGFYLVLPIVGPSSARDGFGRAVDTVTNPISWIGGQYEWVKYAMPAAYLIDYRANNFEILDNIYKTSIDPYSAIRSLYLQRRDAQIRNEDTSNQGTGRRVFP